MADDEGVDWILSNLATNHGAIEYRDFGHDYMPLNFYFLGIAADIFGGDIFAQRVAVTLLDTVIAPILLFVIAIRVTRSRAASIAAVAVYYIFSPYPLLKGTVFLAAVATIIYLKDKPGRAAAAIGFAIAVCAFTAQEFGVYIAVTYAAVLGYDRYCRRIDYRAVARKLAWAAVGAAILVIPFAALYLVTGSFGALFHYAIIKGFFRTPGTMNLPYPWGIDVSDPLNWIYYFYPLVLAFAVYRFFFGPGVTSRSDTFVVLIAFAVCFTTASGRADGGHIRMGVVLLGVLVGYVLTEALGRRQMVSATLVSPLAKVVPLMVLAAEYWILARNVTRYKWQIAVAVGLAAAAFALFREKKDVEQNEAAAAAGSMPLFVFVTAAIVFFASPVLASALREGRAITKNTRLLKASFKLSKPDPTDILGMQFNPTQLASIRKIKTIVDEQTKPDDRILVFPLNSFLYAVVHRKNVCDNYQFLRSIDKRDVASVIKALEEHRPQIVIYDKTLGSITGTDVNFYLLRHYKLLDDTGWLEVLKRTEQPNKEVALNQQTGDFMPDTKVPEYIYANYRKTGLPDVAGRHYADALFQHPPYAETVTLQREAILRGVVELRFDVMGDPEATGDLGRAEALVRDKSGKGYRAVFEKQFKDSKDREGTGDFLVPPQGIDALRLISNLPHGTFWRIQALY